MKNTYLLWLLGLIIAPSVDAIYLLNKTNEAVTFNITLSDRKNSHTKSFDVKPSHMINYAISPFQASNKMNDFSIQVRWNSGAGVCQPARAPGLVSRTWELFGDADNFNAVIYRDPTTGAFTCIIRQNVPGTVPS